MSEYLAAAPEPRRVGQNWGLARGCTGHRVALHPQWAKNIRSRDPQCGIRTGSQVNPMVKLMTAIGLERVGRNFNISSKISSVLTFYCSFCVTALCKIITKQTRVTWISLQVSRQCPPGPMSTNSISCGIFGKINFVRKKLCEKHRFVWQLVTWE